MGERSIIILSSTRPWWPDRHKAQHEVLSCASIYIDMCVLLKSRYSLSGGTFKISPKREISKVGNFKMKIMMKEKRFSGFPARH